MVVVLLQGTLLLLLWSAEAYFVASPNQRLFQGTIASKAVVASQRAVKKPRSRTTTMFIGELKAKKEGKKKLIDASPLGNLKVPSVGIGTISWSSDSRKLFCVCVCRTSPRSMCLTRIATRSD